MKNKGAKVVVFIGSLLVGLLIALNINLEEMQSSKQLTAKGYQDAIEERNNLYNQISNLKNDNKVINDKINNYNKDGLKNARVVEDMRNQLNDYGMLTGLNEVKGQGVVVSITDAILATDDGQFEVTSKMLHDWDVALLINEIRASGAEAIAFNNHRLTPKSGVTCLNAYIGFEDNDQQPAPFKFYVIGDPDLVENSLLKEGSHLWKLKNMRRLDVHIEKKEEIKLPAVGDTNFEYAEENLRKN